MPIRVVDASVIAAVFFQESRAEEGRSLITGRQLYEPTLLAYELANVARKKVATDPVRTEALLDALNTVLSTNIQWMDVDHVRVLRLALETGLTTYDASYLYLARLLDAPLVTFDRQLSLAYESIK